MQKAGVGDYFRGPADGGFGGGIAISGGFFEESRGVADFGDYLHSV